jgi:hypothetical protein
MVFLSTILNKISLYIKKKFNPPIVVILSHDEWRNPNGQSRFHPMTKVRTHKQINKCKLQWAQHRSNENVMGGYEIFCTICSKMIIKAERRIIS